MLTSTALCAFYISAIAMLWGAWWRVAHCKEGVRLR